jgi:hypothetical protein
MAFFNSKYFSQIYDSAKYFWMNITGQMPSPYIYPKRILHLTIHAGIPQTLTINPAKSQSLTIHAGIPQTLIINEEI